MRALFPPFLPVLACIAGAGCTYSYQPLGNAPGTLTVDTPGALPGIPGPAPTNSPSAPPVSGPYAGEAVALNDPGGMCSARMRVTNWTVSGNQVSFGSFGGTIQPDGTLLMQAGQNYIQGRFTGSHFQGRFTRPGLGCDYALTIDPVR
jgi:hypothetical protein